VCVRCPVFKLDPKYLENEERYKSIKAKILLVGHGEDSDEESGCSEEEYSEEEEGQ
jgi:pre-mRNA-splicing factor CWC22